MALYDFITKRCNELGTTFYKVADEQGISAIVQQRIRLNGQIKPVTIEKLARGLQCSQGEIQAALAETPNPLREETTRVEGTHKDAVEKKAPVKWHEDKKADDIALPDKPLPVQKLNSSEEEYKLRLKNKLLKRIAKAAINDEMASVYLDFGYEVAQELLKDI